MIKQTIITAVRVLATCYKATLPVGYISISSAQSGLIHIRIIRKINVVSLKEQTLSESSWCQYIALYTYVYDLDEIV